MIQPFSHNIKKHAHCIPSMSILHFAYLLMNRRIDTLRTTHCGVKKTVYDIYVKAIKCSLGGSCMHEASEH